MAARRARCRYHHRQPHRARAGAVQSPRAVRTPYGAAHTTHRTHHIHGTRGRTRVARAARNSATPAALALARGTCAARERSSYRLRRAATAHARHVIVVAEAAERKETVAEHGCCLETVRGCASARLSLGASRTLDADASGTACWPVPHCRVLSRTTPGDVTHTRFSRVDADDWGLSVLTACLRARGGSENTPWLDCVRASGHTPLFFPARLCILTLNAEPSLASHRSVLVGSPRRPLPSHVLPPQQTSGRACCIYVYVIRLLVASELREVP